MRTSIVALSMLTIVACGTGNLQDLKEIGHAAGDALASLDESAQGGGLAYNTLPLYRPELLEKPWLDRLGDLVMSSAWAQSCWLSQFDACDAGVRSRDFGGCNFGVAKLTGSVTLTFTDSGCSMEAVLDEVTREANFTITGPRDATLTVTSPGGGQTVTRTAANSFTYAVGGLRRVAKGPRGRTLFDIGTRTTEPIGVSGTSRSDRVIDGGVLEITHNLAHYTTTLSPQNLAWSTGCNCPTSGKLSGTVSKTDETQSILIEVTGCGTATITTDEETKDVTFDRCSGN